MILFLLLFLSLAELGPISKGLNTNSRAKACETFLAQACRHGPTLLDYTPSYKGVLRRKEKKKDGEPSVQKKNAPTGAGGAKKTKRQPRVKLPKFGWTAKEWLEPLRTDDDFEPVIPGLNVPLRIIDPTPKEISRRNIPRPRYSHKDD